MKKLIFALLLSTHSFASELTVYVMPSQGIDWSSPKSLLVTGAKSYFSKHAFGFSWVELNCGGKVSVSGVEGDSPGYFSELVWRGSGLGIFYHSFTGKMVSQADISQMKNEGQKSGDLRFVRFTISDDQCKRAQQYISEFEKNNVGRNFGLAHRPRHAEGANPVSYAVSVIDVLNILDQDMKETWIETIKVPMEFAGNPIKDESVSVFSLYGRDSWAKDGEKYQVLTFWNPDRIIKWVNEKSAKKTGHIVIKTENSVGVMLVKSHFPVPQEPIWLQQIDPNDKSKTAIIIEPSRPAKKIIPVETH